VRPRDFYDVVRENWKRTTAYLLAGLDPCVEIRDEELEVVQGNRVLVGLSPGDLDGFDPSGVWLLAVLLCPDGSTERLAEWAARREADPSRVHFYLHPDTNWEALRPWHDAGYPTRQVDDDIESWRSLHNLFGLALSNRIYADFKQTDTA
jgi:hypothetical protein